VSRRSSGNVANSISSKTPNPILLRLDQRAAVAQAIHTIFNSPNCLGTEQRLKQVVATCADLPPKLTGWMEENLPQGFAVFTLPPTQQSVTERAFSV
jgi:hypothetical protein